MSKVNSILDQRLGKGTGTAKMAALAVQRSEGKLSSFSGIFGGGNLPAQDQALLEELLIRYGEHDTADEEDLRDLVTLTSEVRAINNQAAILHGERIKRAQELLKTYREGAFTAWLITAYGNRQTPYNFLQYYLFYQAVPKPLHSQVEALPRQAVYTLASRQGELQDKISLLRTCQGQTKEEILAKIRDTFPLKEKDLRHENIYKKSLTTLHRLHQMLRRRRSIPSDDKTSLLEALEDLTNFIQKLPSR